MTVEVLKSPDGSYLSKIDSFKCVFVGYKGLSVKFLLKLIEKGWQLKKSLTTIKGANNYKRG